MIKLCFNNVANMDGSLLVRIGIYSHYLCAQLISSALTSQELTLS
jgi:hypothetical protein